MMDGIVELVGIVGAALASMAAEHLRRLHKMDKKMDRLEKAISFLPCQTADWTSCEPSVTLPMLPKVLSRNTRKPSNSSKNC